MRMLGRICSVSVFACLPVGSAFGQTAEVKSDSAMPYLSGDPSTWPPETDAVAAAPRNHKILLENDRVRVLEVIVPPRTVEPLHSHRWPSTLYIMEAGDFIDRDAKGNVVFDSRKLPEPLTFPLAMWKEPEAPHSIENLSDAKPIRLVRVEIKSSK